MVEASNPDDSGKIIERKDNESSIDSSQKSDIRIYHEVDGGFIDQYGEPAEYVPVDQDPEVVGEYTEEMIALGEQKANKT